MNTEVEDWFLNTSQQLNNIDVFASRSWLLTAKSIFPQSFRLQLEEYSLELNKKNVEECSRVLNELFRDFSSEALVWEEIEKLIQAAETSADPLRKSIFDSLPALTQQRMLLASAESLVNITHHCKLLLVLMSKFPETISQYGMTLTEKLVETEKKDYEGTPVNHCRKLLVRQVLPVICRSRNVNVSNKHFYKWLQKSTEFYACYFTCESETGVDEAWSELQELRADVAQQCEWNVGDNFKGATLADRMAFMKELFQRSRTDVEGVVNRKQIFYSTLILLFEAASKYMAVLDPSIYRDSNNKNEESFVVIADVDKPDEQEVRQSNPALKNSSDLNETFQVAREAWSILHANDTFEKDFNHLIRRWKCDRWYWFQLYLVNMHVYDGECKSALTRLQQMEQKFQEHKPRHQVKVRTCCHLVSVSYLLGLLNESCQYIFSSISYLPADFLYSSPATPHFTHLVCYPVQTKTSFPLHSPTSSSKCDLRVISLSAKGFLSFWVYICIQSLLKVSLSVEDDFILGHTMVLSQHNWPTWKPQCRRILNRIAEKRSFNFDLFSKFVINIDILEEVSLLKNTKSCRLALSPNHSTSTHVTRGVNREADDDFWRTIKQNVQRSGESIDALIRDYLITCSESIYTCINMVEPR